MATSANIHDARLRLAALDRRTGEFMDALIAPFDARVTDIVAKTLAQISARLASLDVGADGKILRTPGNLAQLQQLDAQFLSLMIKNGYNAAVRSFVSEFPGQLPMIHEALQIIGEATRTPAIINAPWLASPDLKVLLADQKLTVDQLGDVVSQIGVLAKRKALYSVSGLNREQMAEVLSKQFGRAIGESRTLAATSMAMFGRIATERAMDRIEGEAQLRYVYDGPDDHITRPFCHALKQQMAAGKTWTRAMIDRMNNGQIPDVFLSGGGYNCRHQWRLALPEDGL